MDATLLAEFFDNLEKLLDTGEDHDVVIHVGSGATSKEIYAHSSILSTRCTFFKNIFSTTQKENGCYVIKKSHFSELVTRTILKFLYACKLDLSTYSGDNLVKLLLSSDELSLQSLYRFTQDYFIQNHESYIDDNTLKILRIVHGNENFIEVKNLCLDKICMNSEKLFGSSEFQELEKTIFMEILEKDELYVEEIDVWLNILKWCIVRHPEITSDDPEDWTLPNFAAFEQTIKDFIPLIRLISISNENFFHQVMPYQMLFPRALWKEISRYYLIQDDQHTLDLSPSRNKVVNALTITQKVTLLFANWFDKTSSPYTSVNNVKYRFKLLYRSSRDGLNVSTFHKKCDDFTKTIVVAKIQGTDQLIGGYNPLKWNGTSGYVGTTESFIFNIKDVNDTSTATFSYVNNGNSNTAIYCGSSYLPTFGGGRDLQFNANGTISSSSSNYNYINITNGAKFDELEIFQVIVKS